MKKRLIAIALAVCTLLLFAASVSAAGTGNSAAAAVLADNTNPAETPEITRAAWIQSLVSAFSLTVENDNYPDNYFSDLTSDKPYYHDILTAVDFGVVDTPLGEAFRPEEAATREFAAHTLNYCLGYQMDEETGYTFSEAQSITYPEDLQVAVTRGWFQLSGKNALPEQAITAAEKSAMLADAEAALKGEVINENYQNSYSFAEGVVVIPEGTEVTASDTTLTVRNCPVTVAVGDVIAVYQNGIPVVYLTNAVTEQDGALVLTVTHLEETDAYTGIDAQGTVEASLEDVIPLEDSQLGYYVPETDTTYDSYKAALYAVEHMERTQATASTDASTKKIELVCKRTLTFDGASVDISLKFKNVYVDYKISLKEQRAYVKLSYDAEFSYGIKYDAAKAVNADDVDLLFWGVPGVGGVTISLETELSGSAKGIHKFHGACGVEYTKADGVRVPCNIDAKTMAVSAEGTAKLGLKVKFGVTKLPVVKAYLYASAGSTAKLSVKTYNDDALPASCTHFTVYLYAKYGATGSAKLLNYKKSISLDTTIYDEKNSPIRIVRHYEDGTLTNGCTRDGAGIPSGSLGSRGWSTPGGSIYAGSGWSGGNGNTGWENGDPVVIYTYSTDDDGNATITGYNGKASGLVIPSTIDGHTVVAIGDNVFNGNSRLNIVIIPDTVTKIGNGTFRNSGLQTVSIPDSVTKIGNNAFRDCQGLTGIELPSSLTELGGMAFGNCLGITAVTIPKGLTTATVEYVYNRGNPVITTYYPGPFGYCANLVDVTFENGMTKIPDNLLKDCTGAIKTVIPDTVTEIGRSAFECTGLQLITIPDNTTEIGNSAFAGSALQAVTISDSVTKIGNNAFRDCQGLNKIELPSGLTELGGMAFGYCLGITAVTIPKGLTTATVEYVPNRGDPIITTYYPGPFGYCANLTTVTFEDGITKVPANLLKDCTGKYKTLLPDTITVIENAAFESSGLQSIGVPDTVTKIGTNAFRNCQKLTEIELPAGLTELGGMAFGECRGITEITIPRGLTIAKTEYTYTRDETVTLYPGPFGYCENLTSVTFENGIKKVPDCLFETCTGKIVTTIPDSVTEIGRSAFNCSGLQSIELSKKTERIAGIAFRGCRNLETIELPETLKTINENAFENCIALKSAIIPDSVTTLGNAIFKNCSALTEVKFPSTCTGIGTSMFEGCEVLPQFTLPDTVTTIGACAFQDCTALKDIVWSKALTTISYSAFKNCLSLTEIVVPETVTSIEYEAFSNCDALTSITIPDSVTDFGTGMFYDCDALATVKLGSGLTAIPKSTFEHCDVLESLTVPRRVTSIAANVFKDSVKFTSIFIPRSVTSIDTTAFSYPAKLTIYGIPGTYAETFANENSIRFVAQQTNATGVTLDQTTLTLNKGASAQLKLTVTPADFTDAITWKSADTSIATVSDTGLVKAVNNGSTVIKVTVGNVSASCKVTVVQPVTSISLNKTSLTLEALDSYQLTATVNPSNAANRSVTWASSDGSVASVTQDGLVTALKKGTAVITVSAQDGSGVQKTCTVTVSNTAYICPTPDELESPHNYPDSCSDIWIYTKPGAESLQVTFDARTNMEDGFDYLYIYDASGNQVGKYTGTVLAGQTITVPGDTVRIKLVSDSSGNAWGFKVSRVQSAGDGMPGDLDGDGELTSADVVLLARYLAGAETLTEAQLTAADLNADGVITSADLVLLARKVAGLE